MWFLIPISIFAIFIIIAIVVGIKFSKPTFHNFKNMMDFSGFKELKDLAVKMSDSLEEITTTNCEYCGAKCEKGEYKCPNCGASISEK